MSPITDVVLILISAVIVVAGAMVAMMQLSKGRRKRLSNCERRRKALEAAISHRSSDDFIARVNRASSSEELDRIIRESSQE